jgi:hypothetical protein
MDFKSKKLLGQLEKLIKLFNHSQDSSIEGLTHDRYYYIQKKAELTVLEEEAQKAAERIKILNERIRVIHSDLFLDCCIDLRVFSKLNTSQKEKILLIDVTQAIL